MSPLFKKDYAPTRAMTIRRIVIPFSEIKDSYEMATTRRESKTITLTPDSDELVEDVVTQRKRPDSGRFRLQVDRQTKESYTTYEAAEAAGLAIKKAYPILQVAVYDAAIRCCLRLNGATKEAMCFGWPSRSRSTRLHSIA